MNLEQAIEDSINDISKQYIGLFSNFGTLLIEGFKEALDLRFLTKDKKLKKMLTLVTIIIITTIVNLKAEIITDLCSNYIRNINLPIIKKIINDSMTIKVLSALIPITYLSNLGSKIMKMKKSFDSIFNSIGFTLKTTSMKKLEDGRSVQVKQTPLLIKYVELSKECYMMLFSYHGTTMDQWEKYRNQIEDKIGLKIYRMDKTKSNRAIRLITVTDTKFEELTKESRDIEAYDKLFEKVGLCGKGVREREYLGKALEEKNYPTFIKEESETINGKKVTTRYFRSIGTELKEWKEKKYSIENVFNCRVHEIKLSKKSNQVFELTTLNIEDGLKELYPWNDKIISKTEGELIVGEGLIDKVRFNVNESPHTLVGGVTGAGKSVLMNCLVWQFIKQGAHIELIDFKGGVELSMFKPFNNVITDIVGVDKILDNLVKEHEERLELFVENEVQNIIQYNELAKESEKLARIVIVIDEVSQVLSKVGKGKGEIKLIDAVEGKMNALAALSRATGINLLMGTQRPDAKVLGGQIKNNLSVRICGRMIDKEPSIMVLGSPQATDIEDIKGRYLISLGADPIPMQAYFFKKSDIKVGNYRKGRMLVLREPTIISLDNKESVEADKVSIIKHDDFEEIDNFDDLETNEQNYDNEEYENDNDESDEEDFEPEEEIIDVTLDDDVDYEEVI